MAAYRLEMELMVFLPDLKQAFRGFRRTPGFTAVALLTLALGLGANTAIFSMVNSVLIRPLPYPDPEQLVYVREALPDGSPNGRVSGGAFMDWRAHSSSFAYLAIFEDIRRNLTGAGLPERVTGLQVSSEFLSVLGVTPMIGRDLRAGEDAVGGENRVVLLTHHLWQSRFGGDAGVVGRTVSLDQIPFTVIGVLPPNALLHDDARFLVPEVMDAAGVGWGRAGHWREVIGRLAPGVTTAGAQAELNGIKRQLAAQYPSFKKDWSVSLTGLHEIVAGGARPRLVLLLGAVALVLLIACVNVSNLLLARGTTRSRELAIRIAMGARSSRILRQMLTESVLLALAGCALGLLLAMFGVRLLAHLFAEQLPVVLQPTLDFHVLLFSMVVACGCGLLFGILPALRARKTDLHHVLNDTQRGSTSGSGRRSQSFLVGSELAFTVVLLIGAGLFLRSFILLMDTDPGFDPRQTLAFDLTLPEAKYPDAEARLRFIKDLIGRIGALPGVDSVGVTSGLPLSNRGDTEAVSRADGPERAGYLANCSYIGGDYFRAMGIRLRRGRPLADADNTPTAARVLVIDDDIARDLFPGEDPIGRSLRFQAVSWEIVGLVAPVRHSSLDLAPRPNIYLTHARYSGSTSVILRTASPPLSLAETVRKTILKADPDQPIANVRTLEQAVSSSLMTRRTSLILLGLFAAIGVGLACVGVYGVVSYAVAQRAREMSIRAALGAQHRDIMRLVFKECLKPSILGIVVGLLATLMLASVLGSQLYQVKAYDPLVFVGSVCLLGMVAALSIYIPARRATRLDPVEVMRCE